MTGLAALRRWLRRLEPRVHEHLERSWLAGAKPWLERRQLFRFQRQPLAKGVAVGLFCGLIPGPLQLPSTLMVCACIRANLVAGGVATFYTNPITTLPLYALAFQLGALVIPGPQVLPTWDGAGEGVAAMADWVQALGWPLLVGLPTLGLLLAVVGFLAVHALWLLPAVQRGRRWQRMRCGN